MQFEYITDRSGRPRSVVIDIAEWRKLQKRVRRLEERAAVRRDLSEAMAQVKESGRSGRTLRSLIEELLNSHYRPFRATGPQTCTALPVASE